MDDAVESRGMQASPFVARALEAVLERFLAPLVAWLDTLLDKRLVRTLVASIVALVEWRNRAHSLLLSELGAYICDPAHAPAGTKRLSNLLRSPRWEANLLNLCLWQQATQRLAALETAGETPLLIRDTSVLEKPESIASADLGRVRSSKAQRLTHIKPGFYHPPTRPLFVPGWRWIGLLLVGLSGASGPPCVADMRWWTTRGPSTECRASTMESRSPYSPSGVSRGTAARRTQRLRQSDECRRNDRQRFPARLNAGRILQHASGMPYAGAHDGWQPFSTASVGSPARCQYRA